MRIVTATAVAALASAAVPSLASGSSAAQGEALDRALHDLVAMEGGPPGAIAIVQRGRDRSVHTAGVSDVETGRGIEISDHMRIASVSKAFSGAVALALVKRGKLSLEDTIGQRLPALPPAWHPITLRQLLNHTSGVPSYTKDPEFLDFFVSNPEAFLEPQVLLDFVADEPLRFTPGTSYEYSNSDNILIGLMASAATGTSYEQQLAKRVFDPLGLSNTSLPSGVDLPSPLIRGYQVAPGMTPEDLTNCCNMSLVGASGGLQSTPAELNRFFRAYVGQKLFGRAQRRQQFQFAAGGSSEPPGPGDNSAGLAIFRYRTSCGTVFGHTGNFPGYTQFGAASRNGRRSVTVSANTQLSVDAGVPAVFEALRAADELAVCAALAR
jgi:D-alanyl-D-alanine carboxypeptidase